MKAVAQPLPTVELQQQRSSRHGALPLQLERSRSLAAHISACALNASILGRCRSCLTATAQLLHCPDSLLKPNQEGTHLIKLVVLASAGALRALLAQDVELHKPALKCLRISWAGLWGQGGPQARARGRGGTGRVLRCGVLRKVSLRVRVRTRSIPTNNRT